MARIRSVKPEFFRHEGLYDAERAEGLPLRVAFAGLWTSADREGRFRWKPRQLKLDCLPFDDVDFSRVLDALTTRGFVVKYAEKGVEYGYIPSWKLHQVINNREAQSTLPEPNENNILTREPRVPDATATPLVQDRGEGKGREGNKEGAPDGASDPKKELFDRGRAVLGPKANGLIAKVLRSQGKEDDPKAITKALALILQASTKTNPAEWLGRVLAPAKGEFKLMSGMEGII